MLNPEQRDEFHRRSEPLSTALISHLRALVPRDWRLAILQLDAGLSPVTGTRTVRHRLWNPLTDHEIKDFPQALFDTTTALHQVFSEYQQAWTRCLVLYRLSGGGVECESHYHYPGPPAG